jgi:hypothetical protein
MNIKDSIVYFEKLKTKAQKNCDCRIKRVADKFQEDLLGEKSYHKDYQEVIGWMFELYKVNSTTFYSLFKNVMSGSTDLTELKGLEEMRSFVGNFFDDSYVKLVVDENRTYTNPSTKEVKKIPIDPILDWHLAWANDTEECLSKDELVDVMRKAYKANYEWCKRCNKRWGGDKSTDESKYDLTLLGKSK